MIIKRDFYLNKLIKRQFNGRIKIITGIRRCGKSILLFELFTDYLKQQGVKSQQILSLKLDEATNARYRNPLELDTYIREHITDPSKRYYILLDEIQEVKTIQNPWLNDKGETIGFVDILLGLVGVKNIDVYITGSNSKMLSSDVLTEFKDRGDEIHISPFVYKEFCEAYKENPNAAWKDYTTYGGLPRIISETTDEDKSQYLLNLVHKTYLTDVIERNGISKDITILESLLNIIASCIGSLTNPTKLENTFKTVTRQNVSNDTISKYLSLFIDAYILRKAKQYDVKGRKYIGTPIKYYFTDIGLRNAQLNFSQQEENHIMENIIFNELCARGFNVDVGVVEYNYKDDENKSKRTNLEVDFVVNKGNQRCYIQSAFSIPDDEKRKQETNSLCRINDSYRKIVVVRDAIKPWTDTNGIFYVGIEEFLLKIIDNL
ncbi:MAG: ATP-binding protein [Paludibacteraceae bacterium]|nr:ATP-binding protein [Paludibacteraceae bacterium]